MRHKENGCHLEVCRFDIHLHDKLGLKFLWPALRYTWEENGTYKNLSTIRIHFWSKNTNVLEQPQIKNVSHIEVNFNTCPFRYMHFNYFTNNLSSLLWRADITIHIEQIMSKWRQDTRKQPHCDYVTLSYKMYEKTLLPYW